MIKPLSPLLIALALVIVSACITVAPTATQPATGPTLGPARTPGSTSPPTPEPASQPPVSVAPPSVAVPTAMPTDPPSTPAAGNPTVILVVQNGPDAGTYTSTIDPGCSLGQVGAGTWGVAFGDMAAGAGALNSVRIIDEPDSSNGGKSRIFSAVIGIGPIIGGRMYMLNWDRFADEQFNYDVQDHGSTATIHVAGTTSESPLGPGGVKMDLLVNCPSVARA